MKKAGRNAKAGTVGRSSRDDETPDVGLRDFDLLRHLPHLLRRAHFDAEAIFPEIYGDDLTSRQLTLLTAIGQRPGLSQSAVAQQVGMDLNTCSDLVTRLVAKKLLRRERSAADARTYRLHPAPKGARRGDGHRPCDGLSPGGDAPAQSGRA